ncbi:MAG: hypothetical protein E7812_00865 [Phenylobacterium sp.]|nr:MAG: hypothetical protein E7812_00865 [Phenylobacterium sp.]
MNTLTAEVVVPRAGGPAVSPGSIARYLRRAARQGGAGEVYLDVLLDERAQMGPWEERWLGRLRDGLRDHVALELFFQAPVGALKPGLGGLVARMEACSKVLLNGAGREAPPDDWEARLRGFIAELAASGGRGPAVQVRCAGEPGDVELYDRLAALPGVRGVEIELGEDGELAAPALSRLFLRWISEDDPNIACYPFYPILHQLKIGQPVSLAKEGADRPGLHIDENGGVTFMATHRAGLAPTLNVLTSAPEDLFRSEAAQLIRQLADPPTACRTCCWWPVCGGGAAEHRWSADGEFRNPSSHCAALDDLYTTVAGTLMQAGLPYDQLEANLQVAAASRDAASPGRAMTAGSAR